MIVISALTVAAGLAAGAVVGNLTYYDSTGTVQPSTNFDLDQQDSGYFAITGNQLVTTAPLPAAGNYGVHIYALAPGFTLGDSNFTVAVTVATDPPPPNSPDGTVLSSGKAGTLQGNAGAWTFGAVDPTVATAWQIVLNGMPTGNYGSSMEVDKGGNFFYQGVSGHWWEYSINGTWTQVTTP